MKDLLPHEKPLLDYQNTLNELKKHNDKNGVWSDQEIQKLEVKLDKIKKKIYTFVVYRESKDNSTSPFFFSFLVRIVDVSRARCKKQVQRGRMFQIER